MSQPAAGRFLIYQPNHGFGVELFILETAFEIARTLNRTLVLPRMPELETTIYRHSLDSYFLLDTDWAWLSTEQYCEAYGSGIDLVFHIIPWYRQEYTSAEIRDLHPVWLDNIEHLTSFTRMGFDCGDVTQLDIRQPMTFSELARRLESEQPMIGISYIHGLVEGVSEVVEQAIMKRSHRLHYVPTAPQQSYLEMARAFAGDAPYNALHWRRGHHLEQVARMLDGATLPAAEEMMRLALGDGSPVIIATDVGLDELRPLSGGRELRSFRHEDRQVNAVVDMALCINASRFIGTDASTFSAYIAYARYARGCAPESTVLL